MDTLPLGKLPPELLDKILKKIPIFDDKVIVGPGTGLDCAVIDLGDQCLVLKSDPISFTSENIGWYAVEINVNDIVTTGAEPKWMLLTTFLPENSTTPNDVEVIIDQLINATNKYGISIIGGHTEITCGINRPILSATMIGTVDKDKLITPRGVMNDDIIYLTKEIAIETIAILSNDFPEKIGAILTDDELIKAQSYLHNPGISVYKEARLIRDGFGVTAMHDPTEGGVAAALWELSIASNKSLIIDLDEIPVSDLVRKICDHFSINPLNSISSGALLFTVNPEFGDQIAAILKDNQVLVSKIGYVSGDGVGVMVNNKSELTYLVRPARDEITRVF